MGMGREKEMKEKKDKQEKIKEGERSMFRGRGRMVEEKKKRRVR